MTTYYEFISDYYCDAALTKSFTLAVYTWSLSVRSWDDFFHD